MRTSVDVSEADWRKCDAHRGVSDRSALRILVWVRMSMKPQRATALAAEPLRQL